MSLELTKKEFIILRSFIEQDVPSLDKQTLSEEMGLSLENIESTISMLQERGLLSLTDVVTDFGYKAMRPYRVDNAVIMAAGFASRCAPLSYEKPKGLFTVKGEILIERQIRQLQEAGINEIYVVVGYMKELFFYLEEKFGVKIIVNDDYYKRNNTSSLFAARYYLRNTFVCSSDNYFSINPFDSYVYESYFAVIQAQEETNEWVVNTDSNDVIVEYGVGGKAGDWFQIGEFYWTKDFSRLYMDLLEAEYDEPEVADMLLDAFYTRHIKDLVAVPKKYSAGDILEFDTVDEIKSFDDKFVENMDSKIIENICNSLNCSESDVSCFEQIKRGNTNVIFSFWCRGDKYVYRHPGKGSEKIINRNYEAFAQRKADDLGIDGTTVAIDPLYGWKISKWVEGCYDYEYGNESDALRAFALMHKLHEAKIKCSWKFDILDNCRHFKDLAGETDSRFELSNLEEEIERLYHHVEADGVEKVMCHNDMCDSNLVFSKYDARVIDWEYAGLADPASDVCSYIVGVSNSKEEVDKLLVMYFGRSLTNEELRHMYGFIALCSYHWLMWGIYRRSVGHDVGALLYIWFKYVDEYTKLALSMYESFDLLLIP